MVRVGERFERSITLSPEEVSTFARLAGDKRECPMLGLDFRFRFNKAVRADERVGKVLLVDEL